MLEQISTQLDQYTLPEQSYTPTKQSNETCNNNYVFFVQYKCQTVHFIN